MPALSRGRPRPSWRNVKRLLWVEGEGRATTWGGGAEAVHPVDQRILPASEGESIVSSPLRKGGEGGSVSRVLVEGGERKNSLS